MDAKPKYQVAAVQPEDPTFPYGKRFMAIDVNDPNDRYCYETEDEAEKKAGSLNQLYSN